MPFLESRILANEMTKCNGGLNVQPRKTSGTIEGYSELPYMSKWTERNPHDHNKHFSANMSPEHMMISLF